MLFLKCNSNVCKNNWPGAAGSSSQTADEDDDLMVKLGKWPHKVILYSHYQHFTLKGDSPSISLLRQGG